MFERSGKWIDDALETPGHRVLVNCWAGISRSATVTLAFLVNLQISDLFGGEMTDSFLDEAPRDEPCGSHQTSQVHERYQSKQGLS